MSGDQSREGQRRVTWPLAKASAAMWHVKIPASRSTLLIRYTTIDAQLNKSEISNHHFHIEFIEKI